MGRFSFILTLHIFLKAVSELLYQPSQYHQLEPLQQPATWSVKNPNLIPVVYTTEKFSLRDEQEILYQPSQGLSGKSQLCLNLSVHDHR
jgi:hypothetical protein